MARSEALCSNKMKFPAYVPKQTQKQIKRLIEDADWQAQIAIESWEEAAVWDVGAWEAAQGYIEQANEWARQWHFGIEWDHRNGSYPKEEPTSYDFK